MQETQQAYRGCRMAWQYEVWAVGLQQGSDCTQVPQQHGVPGKGPDKEDTSGQGAQPKRSPPAAASRGTPAPPHIWANPPGGRHEDLH